MKTFAAVAIFAVTLLMGAVPIAFSSSKKLKSLLNYCNALTTGIFLSIGLIHLLPEAVERFTASSTNDPTVIFIYCAATALVLQVIETIGKRISKEDNSKYLPYFLAVVLAIHSILEGCVLGFESNPSYAVAIFIAIIAHKGAESFSLITNMVTHNISRNISIAVLIIFSFMTPIGIFTGAFLINSSWIKANNVLQPYFNAAAAGTFIYMAINNKSYKNKNNITIHIALALIGFTFMAILSHYIS